MEKFLCVVAKESNTILEERISKERMACLDLEDSFNDLRIIINAKFKRLSTAIERERISLPLFLLSNPLELSAHPAS